MVDTFQQLYSIVHHAVTKLTVLWLIVNCFRIILGVYFIVLNALWLRACTKFCSNSDFHANSVDCWHSYVWHFAVHLTHS